MVKQEVCECYYLLKINKHLVIYIIAIQCITTLIAAEALLLTLTLTLLAETETIQYVIASLQPPLCSIVIATIGVDCPNDLGKVMVVSFLDLPADDYVNLPYFCGVHERMIYKQAMFDSRVFNIPKEEVNNCLLWRQQDATRNSIQSVAQANFSHKQLEGKNCNELQEMLWQEKGINWNDYPTHLKRGSCCVKSTYTLEIDGKDVQRSKWVIDNEIPIFSQNTWYVNGRITFDE